MSITVFALTTTQNLLTALDANFQTPVTIGSSQVTLGNTITSIAGLANISGNASGFTLDTSAAAPFIIKYNGAEVSRFTDDGGASALFIGTTIPVAAGVNGIALANSATNGGQLVCGASGSTGEPGVFFTSAGIAGTIVTSGTSTIYGTSSDARLKKDILGAEDSGAIVDALPVRKFDWNCGGHVPFGFVAQELNAVFPLAVAPGDDGEKIAKVWQIDNGKVVPLLVKEIQSLRLRVWALENSK